MTVITSIRVEIAAPAPFVWDILLDYPNYPHWNPYTISVSTSLAPGSPIDLTLPSPTGTIISHEYIRTVSPPHHLRYDTGDSYPGLLGTRDQWITPLPGDRCSYHTTETFTGPLTETVIKTTGPWIKSGFDSVALALRSHAEHLWSTSTSTPHPPVKPDRPGPTDRHS